MLPSPLPIKKRSTEEHDEQKKLIVFITNELQHRYPVLRWIYANQNGINLSGLKEEDRNKLITKLINEGLKKGVCDLFLPVRSPNHSGLYIEMKSKTGSLSKGQKEFKTFVEGQGFKVVVPRSAREALREIVMYCELPLTILVELE
jgi:hypothetical protein